jgi:hypothetical protein
MGADLTKPKLTIAEVSMGYTKPVDRSDRMLIDLKRLLILLKDKSFFNTIDNLWSKLKLPELLVQDDLQNKGLVNLPHRVGINSKYLNSISVDTRETIEKEVYSKVLKKYELSFNFYPFIEFYLLYHSLLKLKEPISPVQPNPKMYELYKKYPLEFLRNSHTTSDINFFIMKAKSAMHLHQYRADKDDLTLLRDLKTILQINKNKERGGNIDKLAMWYEGLKALDLHKKLSGYTEPTTNEWITVPNTYEYLSGDVYGLDSDPRLAKDNLRKLIKRVKKYKDKKLKN